MPKVGSNCICLTVILIDFALKKDRNYYPQVFLKEYDWRKYSEEKVMRYITDDLQNSSNDSDEENYNKSSWII